MRLATAILLVVATAGGARSEVIDRIVATVGRQVITESEIRKQTRITQFLNDADVDPGPAELRKTTDRLVEQELLRQEMTASRFPMPGLVEAQRALEKLKAESFKSAEEYQSALTRYGIREEELKEALLWQIAILRFCEFRFSADLLVSSRDVEDYYNKKFRDDQAPKLDAVRQSIERILISERANQSLDQWLKEARGKTRVEIRQESFR